MKNRSDRYTVSGMYMGQHIGKLLRLFLDNYRHKISNILICNFFDFESLQQVLVTPCHNPKLELGSRQIDFEHDLTDPLYLR